LLLEGQRYAFSEYCIQQNNLIAVTEKITDVTFKIIKGYNSGEEVRGTFYTQVSINLIKCFHKSKIKQYEISKKITSIL
jgi:hypothetical protein